MDSSAHDDVERPPGPSRIYIYADESCLGNQFRARANPGAAAGLVEQFRPREGWLRKDFACFEPDTTNNRMALWSGIFGLSALRRPEEVVFTSDSQYLVKGMKEWIHGWARRGWRRKGGPIENLELWKRLARVAARHEVEWRWVRGHAGHPKNEYANMLAQRTAETGEALEGLAPSGFDEWIQAKIDAGTYVDYLDVPPEEPFDPDPVPPLP
ncbi:MAG TPA: ribonuclease H [Gemmatimonadota bacterium]|nr:ribonuclease H [Gemmatimonadota bacterium]